MHLSIIPPPHFPHTLSFAIIYPSTSIMCFKPIPVVSRPRSNITCKRQRNPANLRPFSTSSTTPLSFSMALWNCQSVINKADFISAFSLQSTLSILGLTETWIHPEDSATPAALSSNFSFSHTPRQVGRGGGTGLLISNNWKYSTHSPLLFPALLPVGRSCYCSALCSLFLFFSQIFLRFLLQQISTVLKQHIFWKKRTFCLPLPAVYIPETDKYSCLHSNR